MQAMDAAEQRRLLETVYPRALRAAQRAFKRWPRRKREDAIAERVGKVWMTWVLNMEKGKDPVALLGPNIHFAILRVRHDRKNAGRARGFDMFDGRANSERHPFLIIGGESRVARFGPTTPTRARFCQTRSGVHVALEHAVDASSNPDDARIRKWEMPCQFVRESLTDGGAECTPA